MEQVYVNSFQLRGMYIFDMACAARLYPICDISEGPLTRCRLKFQDPRTLHTKLQIMQLSSIHTAIFFTAATIFSTVFYMNNDFLTNFLKKIFAVLCAVCKGL